MMTRAALCKLAVLLFLWTAGRTAEFDFKPPSARAPGDVMIGALFPIHGSVEKNPDISGPHLHRCFQFVKGGITKALGMINAIENINKSPILRNLSITLGYQIYDSCYDVTTGLRAIAKLTEVNCEDETNSSTCDPAVVALIGASNSEMSIAVARQLTLQMIPQISYSSTAVTLSNKVRFPAFMRTVPNDLYQTRAMARLFSDSGWNWVGMLTTDGDYGRSALDSLMTQTAERGICVAFIEMLPLGFTSVNIDAAIRKAARTILDNPRVKVIVAFVKAPHMSSLFQEMRRLAERRGLSPNATRRIWLASDSWSSYGSVHGTIKLEDIGHVLGITFKRGDLSNYNHFLNRVEAAGPKITENISFLEELYAEKNGVSEAIGDLRVNIQADTVFSVEMAVSAVAHAVADLCRSRDCKRPAAIQPWELLKTLRSNYFEHQQKKFNFDNNGDINLGYDLTMWRSEGGRTHVHNVVAEYHPGNNSFTHPNASAMNMLLDLRSIVSTCTDSCIPGQFKKTTEGQHTCCYECINCTVNHYSNDTDMDLCLSCDPLTEWSPGGSSSCIPKTLVFFSWQDGFAVALLAIAALGVVLVIMVSILFLCKRETPVVKAAGGPLCQSILFSLLASFISAALFVGEPNDIKCKARQMLFGLSFTVCISCILVKSLKILLAFQVTPGVRTMLHRIYKPWILFCSCLALQIATCTCWLVLKCPYSTVQVNPETIMAECHEGSYVAFGVMLGYNAILALVCFICAFMGRKLPEKYNEAKFITFGMLLYLISWLIFIPVYVTTSGLYVPAVEMVVILISNYGILGCHFFPKCYIILFRQHQNTRSAFKQNVYEYSRRCTENAISAQHQATPVEQPVSQAYIIPVPEPVVSQGYAEVTQDCTHCTRCGSNKQLATPILQLSLKNLVNCTKRHSYRKLNMKQRSLRRSISM